MQKLKEGVKLKKGAKLGRKKTLQERRDKARKAFMQYHT